MATGRGTSDEGSLLCAVEDPAPGASDAVTGVEDPTPGSGTLVSRVEDPEPPVRTTGVDDASGGDRRTRSDGPSDVGEAGADADPGADSPVTSSRWDSAPIPAQIRSELAPDQPRVACCPLLLLDYSFLHQFLPNFQQKN